MTKFVIPAHAGIYVVVIPAPALRLGLRSNFGEGGNFNEGGKAGILVVA